MIAFENVGKRIHIHGRVRDVLSRVSVEIPSNRRIAVLANSANDRMIFIQLLAGLTWPTSGRISRRARVSFPVGYLGGFSAELSVRANVAYAARLYGACEPDVVTFVERMTEIGAWFDKPFRDLPGPLKNFVATVVAYAIPFDLYLLNREFARSKGEFGELSKKVATIFEARARTSGMIIATANNRFARENCDMGLVLHRGQVLLFDDVDQAIAVSDKWAAEACNSCLRY